MTLKKDISNSALLFAAFGGIVGSGWLLGPFYAAKVAGPAAMLSWVIGGGLMMIIALTFAELATTYPVAGGMVRFAQFSHGRLTSFTMAWISWLAAVMVAPIETMAAMQYAGNYLPHLTNDIHGKTSLTGLGIFIAAIVMFVMCCINSLAVKYFAKSNSIIVMWKIAIPIITILLLLHYHFNIANFTDAGGFSPYGLKGILSALPTAGVIFSFIGYSPAIQLAGEAKNPQRAIPIAIFGAIGGAIILYVLIQMAFVGAVSSASISGGWHAMHYVGDAGPIAGILAGLGLVWFVKVIYLDAIISPVGTAFIYTAATARMNIAMSQNGYMPNFMQRLSQHGSPYIAIAVNFVVGMIFFFPFPGWSAMVSFLVSCFVLAYAVGPIACAVLRKTEPAKHRPFRLPYAYPICLVAFYICNLIVYWTGWSVISKMLITIAIGYVVLGIQHVMKKDKMILDIARGIWLIPYLAGLGLISYFGSFGGDHDIAFGWDFVIIAIFSVVIFMYAVHCGVKHKALNQIGEVGHESI